MTETVLEKRRFPRKSLNEPAQVLDNDTGLQLGILEDISNGGFSLLTSQAIRQDETRSVTLMLPGPQDGEYHVSLVASCVWCQSGNKHGDHPKDYSAGFQLQDIDEQNRVALNYFIRDY